MKRLGFFLLASGLFWTGCIGNDSLGTSTTAQRNIENLARISIGMTSDQVFQIMRQPYRSEIFELDDSHYEVWFYVTSMTLMEQKRPTHTNLTPLTFKNGVLQGKGYNHYQALLTQEEAKAGDDVEPKQDTNLEKALQPPPGPVKPVKPIPPPPEPASKTPTKQKPKQAPSSYPPQPKQPPAPKQPAAPVQPTQPPPSVQPTTPPKTTSTQNKLSMSKKPSSDEPPQEAPNQPANTTKKPAKDKKPPDSKSNVPLTEKDQQMIDQEQEENFDFW